MGSGKGGGDSDSTVRVEIPEEIQPMIDEMGRGWASALRANPFFGPDAWWQSGGWNDPRYGGSPFGSLGLWGPPQATGPIGEHGVNADWFYPQSRGGRRVQGRLGDPGGNVISDTRVLGDGDQVGDTTAGDTTGGNRVAGRYRGTIVEDPEQVVEDPPLKWHEPFDEVAADEFHRNRQETDADGSYTDHGSVSQYSSGSTPTDPWVEYDWVPGMNDAPMTGGELGFWGPNMRQVAGPSPLETWAALNVGETIEQPEAHGMAMDAIRRAMSRAGDRPLGLGLTNALENPAFAAAKTAYQNTIAPDIENRRSLMGLGSSDALATDLAMGWSNIALPLIQDELGREERAIERGVTAGLQGAGQLTGIGDSETARRLNTISQAMGIGATGREIANQFNDAQYEDFLRRQGMWENLWMGPLGILGSTFGRDSSTRTDSGGLFK